MSGRVEKHLKYTRNVQILPCLTLPGQPANTPGKISFANTPGKFPLLVRPVYFVETGSEGAFFGCGLFKIVPRPTPHCLKFNVEAQHPGLGAWGTDRHRTTTRERVFRCFVLERASRVLYGSRASCVARASWRCGTRPNFLKYSSSTMSADSRLHTHEQTPEVHTLHVFLEQDPRLVRLPLAKRAELYVLEVYFKKESRRSFG